MGVSRLFGNLKKLLSKKASTLVETLVAMVLIGIVGMMLASGLMTALRFYTMGKEIRTAAEQARTVLYEHTPSTTVDGVIENTECYGEFFVREDGKITCLTYSVGGADEAGEYNAEFIYYPSAEAAP
ncbi:MAG: PilW family protein [Oscillospiraceae bacterium]